MISIYIYIYLTGECGTQASDVVPSSTSSSSSSSCSANAVFASFREQIEKLKGELEIVRKYVSLEDEEYAVLERLQKDVRNKELSFQSRISQLMENAFVFDKAIKERVEILVKQVEVPQQQQQQQQQQQKLASGNSILLSSPPFDPPLNPAPCSV